MDERKKHFEEDGMRKREGNNRIVKQSHPVYSFLYYLSPEEVR